MGKRLIFTLLFLIALFGVAWAYTWPPENTTAFNAIMSRGRTITSGGATVHVFLYDDQAKIVFANGTSVPSNGTAGYAKGAIFIDADVATGTSGTYENIGTAASCSWRLVGSGTTGVASSIINVTTMGIASGADQNTVAIGSANVVVGIFANITDAFVNGSREDGFGNITAVLNSNCAISTGCRVYIKTIKVQ